MDITNFLKNRIVLPITLAGASLFASNAYAQGFESDFTGKKDEPKAELKYEETSQEKEHSDFLDGWLRIGGRTSPLERALFAETNLTIKPADRVQITLDGFGQKAWYPNSHGEDLEVTTEQGLFGLGGSPILSKEFELYIQGQIGASFNQFRNAVEMDANKFLFGGKFGLASQETGTRFLLSGYGGKGKADYELLSGFENDGSFDSYFFSGELSQRLFGKSTGNEARSGFETGTLEDVVKGFDHALYASVTAFLQDDKFADLQHARGYGVQLFLPYVISNQESGWRVSVGPVVDAKWYNTDSDLNKFRETKSLQLGYGAKLDVEYKNFIFGLEAGGSSSSLKIDDPGQGIDSDDKKNGFKGAVYIGLKF